MGTMETEDKLPGVIGGSAAGGSSVHSNGSIAESNGSKHHHDTALTNKSGIHMEVRGVAHQGSRRSFFVDIS